MVSADSDLVSTVGDELSGHGYDLVVAVDAPGAVAQCRARTPVVALVDAGDDASATGLDIVDSLRIENPALPVVLAVNRLTVSAVGEGSGHGVHDYLHKPVDGAELVARIAAAHRFGQLRLELDARQPGAAELLRVDPLTGLSSQRSVEEHLAVVASAARRLNTPFSVLVIDVDRLQRVNAEHGRAAGDAVLQSVARTISSRLRGEDVAGRRGGDQFLVVAPHTSLDGAWRLADRILKAVCDQPVVLDDQRDIVVTVSAGCSEGFGEDPGDQVRRAQAALWQAKSTGRNRAVADTSSIAS